MDDPRLMTLLTLVKVKNYTKTADRLFITQPAVTHQIKSLEREYEITIFENRAFELTKQGEILVEYARRMLNQSQELNSAIRASLLPKRTLRLGVSFNSQIILQKKKFLEVLLSIYNSETTIDIMPISKIFESLKEGLIDLAIVDANYDDDLFVGLWIGTFNIVPCCYREGKFKEIKRVTREMLKNNPVIIDNDLDGLGGKTLETFKISNINLSKTTFYKSNSYLSMSDLICATDGIGFMYQENCEKIAEIKKMDLVNFRGSKDIFVVHSLNAFDKAILKELATALKKWMIEE